MNPPRWRGDVFGGLTAMLVAFPSAIAFGVSIYAPLGPGSAAQGAVAGIVGVIVLGFTAAWLGGTKRLITAPCAPAAAMLTALSIQMVAKGIDPDTAIIILMMVAIGSGLLQALYAALGLGRLIKYLPHSVVSGILTAVGLTILLGQIPRWLGVPKEFGFWQAVRDPSEWRWQAILIGAVAIAVTWLAPKITRLAPGPVLGLGAGILTYFILAQSDASLMVSGNPLVVGPIRSSVQAMLSVPQRWKEMPALSLSELQTLLSVTVSLSVLLSVDTLKTCLIVDEMTGEHHSSNRELRAQGIANVAAGLTGGVPGAGTIGPTLINIASGGQTRDSSLVAAVLALGAFLAFGRMIAWMPIAALAGILVVTALRSCDFASLRLVMHRSTLFDFAVVAAVVVAALCFDLIVACIAGIVLAVLWFLREQVRGGVIRSKTYGNQAFSKQVRLPDEMAILEERGSTCVIMKAQGSLFFGTSDRLNAALSGDLIARDYIILDMRTVRSVDYTAARMLCRVAEVLNVRGGQLIFAASRRKAPNGQDLEFYMAQAGLLRPYAKPLFFENLNDAHEYAENRILERALLERASSETLTLKQISIFRGHGDFAISDLEAYLERRNYQASDRIFSLGDKGDELFIIRRGSVRILLPVSNEVLHLATFGPGDFFGEMAFLDNEQRSADAVAVGHLELFVLSRERFDAFAVAQRAMAMQLLDGIARTLAHRLRRANTELTAYWEMPNLDGAP